MKDKSFKIGLLFLSAGLIILSFPKWNLGFCAWFALVPLLRATEHLNFKKTFFCGWLTGTLAFCGILYWIIPTFNAAEIHWIIGLLSLLILSSYIGFYYGIYTIISEKYFKRFSEPVYFLCSISLWVTLEYSRGHLLTGFPWGLLGYSQWKFYPIAQISEWTGIYGVSAMLIAGNLIIYTSLRKRVILLNSLLLLLIPLVINFWLFSNRKNIGDRTARIAVLQGDIDQYKKWSPEFVEEILQSYQSLVQETQSQSQNKNLKLDLTVWPETSVPGWLPEQKELLNWIENVINGTQNNHLIGAVTQVTDKNYNSAFLFDHKGKIAGRYDKIHLVPFGEFVPFRSWLSRWVPVLNQLGGFDAGKKNDLLQIDNTKFATTICYEAIFPELVRTEVLKGAEFIVNITNDGWYLDTAAPEQHFAMNIFRAIENRRSLVRAANTGISGFIKPDGSVAKKTYVYEKIFLDEDIFLNDKKTFYTKFGDVFAWLCCIITFLGIAKYIRYNKNK